uniref:BAI1-associated protein 3-like isoform X2 n=1 Tax=Actinia tenebrosa TaxID=6105 RepID=A0A6P8IKU0_ACTTE
MEKNLKMKFVRMFSGRSQKFDGGFFEKFISIDWKELGEGDGKNAVDSTQIEDLPEPGDLDKIEEGCGDVQEVLSDGKSSTLSQKQREALYCEALYTIIHQVGAKHSSLDPSNGELYVYLQEVLKISQEKHKELYAKTKDRETPRFYLKVGVIEARNLEAKDANGLSDPYCMIGLMSDSAEIEAKKGNAGKKLKKSRTLRELLKNEAIQMTTVRENTLNPEWNETFTMEVNNVSMDVLHIDIWDCDDKEMLSDQDNKVTKIKGFHGVGRYFKDVVQSARATENESTDDFLGYLEYRVKDIPSDGLDEWVKLKSKSSKCRVSGDCHVKVSLSSGNRPDLPQEVLSMYPTFSDVYGALLHEFAAYDLDQAKMMEEQKWEGQLSSHAHFILHQLAIQNDLTPLQEAAMRWRFLSQLHWENPIQYDTLCSLAQDVSKHWKPGKLSEREERSLLKSLRLFVNNCLQLLIKHRDLYPPIDNARFGRLVNLVECLQAVCEMDVYQEDNHEPLSQTLVSIIKESASIWYNKIHAWNEPQESSYDAKLSSMIRLAECVLTDFLRALKFYNKVFFIVGVNYFSLTYCQLELMLANDVRLLMESVKQSIRQSADDQQDVVGEKLFALYLAIRELMSYREHVKTSDNQVHGFDDFHLWFKSAVVRWLDIAQSKAKDRIAKAIAIDKFLRVDPSVMHSTSAVDTVGCFHQILEFWKNLDWPDVGCSYMFVTQLINIICVNALYYADLVFEKMIKEDFYDSDPTQFDVSEQLCVTLNDIEYIRLWLERLPTILGIDQVVSAMTRAHGENSGKHAKTSIDTVISSADEDMLNKIAKIIGHIGQKMAVDIKKFVIQLSWEQNPKPADEAIGPLLQYLDDDLMILNKSLMKSVFKEILEFMWEVVVENFSDMVKSSRGNPPEFFTRLQQSIEIIKAFFHADGVGLPNEQLTGGLYKSLQTTLTIRCMSTNELIQMYFVDLCERQDKSTETYGAVTIRALYDKENRKLLVEVLNARNLVALDTNGLSDPYVVLRLQPAHIFGREERKTKVVKNTLFPLFDETFSFSVTPEQCRMKGACLSLRALDYDMISNDDIEGQAFLPLNILAGLDSPMQGGFANEPQITLNLIHPTPDGVAFEILECRKDKEAETFVKNEKLTYEKIRSAHS